MSAASTPWVKLGWSGRCAIGAALIAVTASAIPLLPPGICFSDSGDLQLASATLGIMHPTGYAGYVTLGWLVSRIPGVDPAYMVSLACLASGVLALWLCILLQVRLGVNVWLASALVLALTDKDRIWSNLVAPEIYAPTLALVAGAIYLLVRYARLGKRRDLLIAAALYGFALANRPPVVFTLPFFLFAWWTARKTWDSSWRQSAKSIGLAAACALLPCFYSLGYLWARDRADIAYNYIEQHNAGAQELPEIEEGAGAKLERIIWLASGAQFKYLMGSTLRKMRMKLRWLRHDLVDPSQQHILAFASLIVGVGIITTFRRCRPSGVLMTGLIFATLVFILLYQIHGQAANLLPLWFAATVCGGVGLTAILPQENSRGFRASMACLTVAMAGATVADAPFRIHTGIGVDATTHLDVLDLETFPQDAVICSIWYQTPPLWYAQHVLTDRTDIDIICTDTALWLERIRQVPERPAFATGRDSRLTEFTVTPFRNVWRLELKENAEP